MTLVSIVTPSFNQSAYLEQTMKSVLDQDFPNIEYIVMDGGSTDSSLDIIQRHAARLAFWTSERDRGQADAINNGMSHAHGEILAWLNSDDYYLPGTISSAVKIFDQTPDVVLIYGDMLAVNERGETINTLKYQQLTLEDLLCFQIIGQPAIFFRREAFEKSGGLDTTFHFLLDHQLWIKIAAQGKISHVDQTWSAARYHAEAKNRAKASEFGREAFRILDWASHDEKLSSTLAKVAKRSTASAYRVDARYLLDSGQSWPALKAWIRALFIHPPTALKRLNLFVSAILNLIGLGSVREMILENRKKNS